MGRIYLIIYRSITLSYKVYWQKAGFSVFCIFFSNKIKSGKSLESYGSFASTSTFSFKQIIHCFPDFNYNYNVWMN